MFIAIRNIFQYFFIVDNIYNLKNKIMSILLGYLNSCIFHIEKKLYRVSFGL